MTTCGIARVAADPEIAQLEQLLAPLATPR